MRWLLLSFLWACGGTPSMPPAKSPLAGLVPTAQTMAKVRELAVKKPIMGQRLSKSGMQGRLFAQLELDYSPAELAGEAAVLRGLGVLSPSADYRSVLREVAASGTQGVYDPAEGELLLPEGDVIEGVVAHELVHALQDQHFGLRSFNPPSLSWDARFARLAVAEGDATLAAFKHAGGGNIEELLNGLPSGFEEDWPASSPLFLRLWLAFPYAGGTRFVADVKGDEASWANVDALYKQPPLSTEQILHRSKYDAKEQPVCVPAPTLTGATLLGRMVLGEFGVLAWLAHHEAMEMAPLAGAGWAGDTAAAYKTGKTERLVWDTRWDSERDALEFATASRAVTDKLGGTLVHDGKRVVIVFGDGTASADASAVAKSTAGCVP